MAELNIEAIVNEMGRMIEETSDRLEESRGQEFVGTAADKLVTATVGGGELRIDIHVLAKRRLDREDLAAAVMEAVHSAEHQAVEAATVTTTLERRAENAVGDEFYQHVGAALQQLRRGSP